MKNWLLLLLLTASLAFTGNAHETVAAQEMATAANQFIASLDREQKTAATFNFGHEQRLDWHFVPQERKGLPLKDLDAAQHKFAIALLASSLSSQGLAKAEKIRSLEEVLQLLEGPGRRWPRDPELYYLSLFGEPGPSTTWGWRFEGHHLSLNFTVVEGEHISSTPSFMGSNPAIVPSGPQTGLQVLADEENLGRELVKSLSADQRSQAILAESAPADIVTSNKRNITPLDPPGITWMELSATQQQILWKLIGTYLRRARGEIAEVDLQRITDAGQDQLLFAWAGGTEPGEGHYYRIQAPTFLLEFDNTQNGANHVHSVYRDFTEDFGEDLLRKHYQESHAH